VYIYNKISGARQFNAGTKMQQLFIFAAAESWNFTEKLLRSNNPSTVTARLPA